MEILMKPFILDTIILFFVMIMIILGYKKGFVVRLYDFVSTLFVIFIAYTVSQPLSQGWIIYSIEPPLQEIGKTVNRFFVFVIIFIIFKLAFKILGIFIKPMIKKVFSILKITQFFDHFLGIILSFLESLLFVYLALAIIISPVLSGGKEMIQHSILANSITRIVPLYTEEMMKVDLIQEFTQLDLDTKDTTCVTIVTDVLFQLDKSKWIDEKTLETFMINYYQDLNQVSLKQETYDKISELCQKNNIESQEILKGIIVSDEDEE